MLYFFLSAMISILIIELFHEFVDNYIIQKGAGREFYKSEFLRMSILLHFYFSSSYIDGGLDTGGVHQSFSYLMSVVSRLANTEFIA